MAPSFWRLLIALCATTTLVTTNVLGQVLTTTFLVAPRDISEGVGNSLAALDTVVYVGAPQFLRNVTEGKIGAVIVVVCTPDTNSSMELPTFINCIPLDTPGADHTIFSSSPTPGEDFGAALATSVTGSLLAVGAPGADGGAGRVDLFNCTVAINCIFSASISSPAGADLTPAGLRFGMSLAFAGASAAPNLAVLMGTTDPTTGAIGYVFDCIGVRVPAAGGTCELIRGLAPSTILPGTNLTTGVPPLWVGTVLVVGVPDHNAVYMWDQANAVTCFIVNDSTTNTSLRQCNETTLLASSFDGFGSQVTYIDTWLLVSAPISDDEAGIIYIYDCPDVSVCSNSSNFATQLMDPSGQAGDLFGTAMAAVDISSGTSTNTAAQVLLAVGAPGVANASGIAFIYECMTMEPMFNCTQIGTANVSTPHGSFGSVLLANSIDGIALFVATAPFNNAPHLAGSTIVTIQDPSLFFNETATTTSTETATATTTTETTTAITTTTTAATTTTTTTTATTTTAVVTPTTVAPPTSTPTSPPTIRPPPPISHAVVPVAPGLMGALASVVLLFVATYFV